MDKHTIKLYNLIFPVFVIFLLPQFLLVGLVFNLIIDGLIVYSILKINKVYFLPSKDYYRTIFKVFGVGYLADLIGAGILMILYGLFDSTINYINIWANPISIVVHLSNMFKKTPSSSVMRLQ